MDEVEKGAPKVLASDDYILKLLTDNGAALFRASEEDRAAIRRYLHELRQLASTRRKASRFAPLPVEVLRRLLPLSKREFEALLDYSRAERAEVFWSTAHHDILDAYNRQRDFIATVLPRLGPNVLVEGTLVRDANDDSLLCTACGWRVPANGAGQGWLLTMCFPQQEHLNNCSALMRDDETLMEA